MPNKEAPLDTGFEGEEVDETPANRLLARLALLVSTLGTSDSRGFGGAIRSKTGVGLVAGGAEYPAL